ncbi:hypothetical protein AAG587_08135 [Vreelandella neptunia]|uniref:hypothetical protein n=1 Tax=Vreelandella neptunia TaxID=115551 RepID=UPI003159C374
MTSTAFDDQFAVCTPEEEEFFREKQAHDDEQARRIEREQRAEDDAVEELADFFTGGVINLDTSPRDIAKVAYAAIKAGRIPGVEIKRSDV